MKKFYDGGIVTSTGPLIGSVSASSPLTLNKMALQNASLSKTGPGLWDSIKANFAPTSTISALSKLVIPTLTTSALSGLGTSANIGSVLDIGANLIGKDYSGKKGNITKGLDAGYDVISNTVGTAIPGVGIAMKAGKLVGNGLEKLGIGTDKMTTADAILGSSFFNLGAVGLINNAFGKKSRKFTVDQNIANNSSYTGTGKFITDAGGLSGKKYGLFSNKARKKANKKMDKAQGYQNTIDDILTDASDRSARSISSSDMFTNRLQLEQSGGLNNIRFGKDGFKFLESFRIKYTESQKNILKYKDGGKIGEKNIIPEGKLHKELHHLDTEDISRKGIPVILKEGDKISQVAEIEREELILRLEVTEKLEELYKEDTNEAAIEAGKLLVKEILHNTIDKGKVIKEIE